MVEMTTREQTKSTITIPISEIYAGTLRTVHVNLAVNAGIYILKYANHGTKLVNAKTADVKIPTQKSAYKIWKEHVTDTTVGTYTQPK